MRTRVPDYFEDFRELLRQRDRWLQAMEEGKITRKQFRGWCRRACERYREQSLARAYHTRPREEAHS